jgi:AcrR family transcriptional regulator
MNQMAATVKRTRSAQGAPENAAAAPKWRRRAEARPDEILDAALSEFLEKGFDQARVEDIAARAGLSKAGVYLYFDSKDDILRALIEKEIAPFARMARSLAEAGTDDPAGTMRGLIAAFMTVIENPRVSAAPRLVISLAGRFPEISNYYRKNVVEHGLAAFSALHRAGVEQGIFRDADSMTVARALVGPLLVHVLWTYSLRGESDGLTAEERARAQIELLFEGLLSRRGE